MKHDTIYKDNEEQQRQISKSSQRRSKNISVTDQGTARLQPQVMDTGARSNAAGGTRGGLVSLPPGSTVYVEDKDERTLDERSSNATPASPEIKNAAFDYLDR